jgi:hypothetical protein
VPFEQFVHVLELFAALNVENFPVIQLWHVEAPVLVEYVPLKHSTHSETLTEPKPVINVPAMHAIQFEEELLAKFEEYFPGPHNVQLDKAMLPIFEMYVPCGQFVH